MPFFGIIRPAFKKVYVTFTESGIFLSVFYNIILIMLQTKEKLRYAGGFLAGVKTIFRCIPQFSAKAGDWGDGYIYR